MILNLIYELARNTNLIFCRRMKPYLSYAFLVLFLIFSSCKSSKKVTSIDFHDGSYVGEVDGKGLKHGKGSYKWLDGSFYEGDFEKDLRHGTGHFRWANGESYKGDYLQDQRTGQGVYTWPDGSFYEGSFLNGKRHGEGVFLASNGAKYEGGWFDDQRHGPGTLTDQNGKIIRGIWQNGKLLTKPIDLPQPTSKPDISLDTAIISAESKPSDNSNVIKNDSEAITADPFQKSNDLGRISVTGSGESKNIILTANQNSEKVDSAQGDLIPTGQIEEEDLVNLLKQQPEEMSAPSSIATDDENIWVGTVDEVEVKFITKLIDGIDTIFDRKTNAAYSGKMRILDKSGNINGELELLNGRMDGEELYYDNGKLTEKNLWRSGKFIKNLPLN